MRRLFLHAACALALVACGSDPGTGTGTGAGSGTGAGTGSGTGTGTGTGAGTPDGAALYGGRCTGCHGYDGSGATGSNITGSETAGIGGWTEAQFLAALRTGVDDEGQPLCSTMPRYGAGSLSDAQVSAIFAWLKTQRNDTANPGSACP